MREILFRGKRIDNGEWAYGDYWHLPEKNFYCISDKEFNRKVDSETVGQYTGLIDKNRKQIFEGIFSRFMKVPKTTGIKYVKYIPIRAFYVLIMKHRNGISMHSLFLTVIMFLHLKLSATSTTIPSCWRWENEHFY